MRRPIPLRTATATGVVLLIGLVLAACGGGSATAGEATTSSTSSTASTVSTSSGSAGATSTTAATAAAGKVSANDASMAELTAAFEKAGISNASRWAKEVDEYRPYSASDPNFTRLRQELSKYNPAAGVIDAIVAILQL